MSSPTGWAPTTRDNVPVAGPKSATVYLDAMFTAYLVRYIYYGTSNMFYCLLSATHRVDVGLHLYSLCALEWSIDPDDLISPWLRSLQFHTVG